ncbi:hypothetical protein KP79_PYT13820 [Mizuhopecten yessoensis]|uniref:MD-2-related lipid-recognition domain-containing protein n=1 Tax=Mizuhopecten yessoensis TaxID=6573 RepID=A0A210QQ32_MIZYE|nr:hypothetical protein KP79_PYT13820 [Mizuhopecten yessoensis]
MVGIYTSLSLALVVALVYCSSNNEATPLGGIGVGGHLPQEAKIGVLKPCDDVEYEFSHVCPHIYWIPGGDIDPRSEIIVGVHLSMPFEIGEGSYLMTVKVEGQPIFEDRLDFTCEFILKAKDYINFPYRCPLAVNSMWC